jgi:uncharacterized membrane protein HdeD (DUF308 family)
MSAGMAGSWWAIGLRSAAAILFAIVVLWLPPQAVAPLVFLFAVYLIADGAFAILAGMRAPRWGSRWPMLILEGSVNLAAAAAVLVWQSVAAVALVPIVATAWAVISGGLLLAAAHRLSGSEGRWILVVAGVVSAGWGALVAILGASDTRTMGLWLVGYALIFGGTLVALAGRWRRATTHLS